MWIASFRKGSHTVEPQQTGKVSFCSLQPQLGETGHFSKLDLDVSGFVGGQTKTFRLVCNAFLIWDMSVTLLQTQARILECDTTFNIGVLGKLLSHTASLQNCKCLRIC